MRAHRLELFIPDRNVTQPAVHLHLPVHADDARNLDLAVSLGRHHSGNDPQRIVRFRFMDYDAEPATLTWRPSHVTGWHYLGGGHATVGALAARYDAEFKAGKLTKERYTVVLLWLEGRELKQRVILSRAFSYGQHWAAPFDANKDVILEVD